MPMQSEACVRLKKRFFIIIELCYSKPMKKEIHNASQLPQVFFCKHMVAGLAGYEDETILVDLAAMMRLMPSMKGVPVYVHHQDVDIETVENADGYVSDCWYNPDDGWLWASFVAVSDAAHEAIRSGWAVSNAYIPEEGGNGGTYTNIPYDRKLRGGEFTHLALVPNPRYELAQIFNEAQYKQYLADLETEKKQLANSKEEKKPMAFKLFRNEKKGVEDVSDLSEVLVNHKGKEVSVQALLNDASEFDELAASLEEGTYEVKVGDGMMTLSELVNKYNELCEGKENESDEDEDKENESEEEEKGNESDDDEKGNSEEKENFEEEKANSKEDAKSFKELKNASKKSSAMNEGYVSRSERIELGKKKF